MALTRLNASYSRTYLGKGNYQGATLLRSIKGRSSTDDVSPPKSHPTGIAQRRSTSMDTDADPISSSDDGSLNNSSLSRKRRIEAPTRTRPTSKRRRLQDEESVIPDSEATSTSLARDDPFNILSSSSQSKRRSQKTYGKKDIQSSRANELRKDQPDTLTSKQADRTSALSGNKRTSAFIDLEFQDLENPQKEPLSPLGTRDDVGSSTTALESENLIIFDSPTSNRKRSGSTSSLSSVNSLASLELEEDHKEELKSGDFYDLADVAAVIRCPLCRNRVARLDVENYTQNPRAMTLKKQQKFCHQHQLREAQKKKKLKGYPDIDWYDLEHSRIPRHITKLDQIIRRNSSSFYLDQLDFEITQSQGNRKALRTYLRDGLLDIAKQGYYGPKGAKIMASIVTEQLAKDLKELNTDNAIRMAGIGAYVAAVLVPELTMRLVMEDMNLENQQEAREILAESTDVGILLHADDDHVILKDEP